MRSDDPIDSVTLILALILLGGVVLMGFGFASPNTLLVSTGIAVTFMTSFTIIIRTITRQTPDSSDLR